MGFLSNAWKSIKSFGSDDNTSSLLDTLVDVGSQYADYALDYRNSRKETTKAYERNLANWLMQTNYNSPSEQMARLKSAGLNPNLIYGSVNNSAGSVSSAPVANSGSAKFDLVSKYQDLRQRDAMTQQIKAQTALALAQAKALGLENEENGENGTSRATPYPVKLAKSAVSAINKMAEPVSNSLSSFSYRNLPSSYNRLVDGVINKIMGKDFDYGSPGDYQRLMRR